MHLRLLSILSAGLLSGAGSVMAENQEGAFTLAPFFGGQGFPFRPEGHFDADYYMGLRGGYNFTPRLGAELMFGYNNTVRDPEEWHCKLYQFGADMLYHFMPEKRWVPFLAIGGGTLTSVYDDETIAGKTYFYTNFGGGVDYALTKRVSLRADYRHAFTMDDGDHFLAGTLSLRFQLGGRK